MNATTTEITTRSGDAAWIVTWGPGLTQSAVCLTKAEADRVASLGLKGLTPAEPQVAFR